MSGKTSRDKGARGERELAEMLTDWLGFSVKRKLGAPRDGGDDIQVGQFRFECKYTEKAQPWAWYKQASENAGIDDIPVVAFRRNRSDWLVILSFRDFMRMMREFI